MEDEVIERDASISQCGHYRWALSRCWKMTAKSDWLGWIMLNPSTADASIDDPTIRRCMSFARRWGFNGMAVRNLFAYRATEPGQLRLVSDPIGEKNDRAIVDLVDVCPRIVCAWGSFELDLHRAVVGIRAQHVIDLLKKAHPKPELICLGYTKDGCPKHPLYVHGETQPLFLS